MTPAWLSLFAAGQCPDKTFLGLLPWYHYLPLNANCEIQNFTILGTNSSIILILLAIIDDLLRIAGLVAFGFIIYGGIRYITSQGSPDQTSKAMSTILNAVGGLVIALVAIGVVSYLGNRLGGAYGSAGPQGSLDISSLPHTPATQNTLKSVLSLTFAVVGGLSFLFIVIGGFRYVLSHGDAQGVDRAKNTILYALIGLIVALLAEALVTFVIGRV